MAKAQKERDILLFIDGKRKSNAALRALKSSGLKFDVWDVRRSKSCDFTPPLLQSREGSYRDLNHIKTYIAYKKTIAYPSG